MGHEIDGYPLWDPIPFSITRTTVRDCWVDYDYISQVLRKQRSLLLALQAVREAWLPGRLVWSEPESVPSIPSGPQHRVLCPEDSGIFFFFGRSKVFWNYILIDKENLSNVYVSGRTTVISNQIQHRTTETLLRTKPPAPQTSKPLNSWSLREEISPGAASLICAFQNKTILTLETQELSERERTL